MAGFATGRCEMPKKTTFSALSALEFAKYVGTVETTRDCSKKTGRIYLEQKRATKRKKNVGLISGERNQWKSRKIL